MEYQGGGGPDLRSFFCLFSSHNVKFRCPGDIAEKVFDLPEKPPLPPPSKNRPPAPAINSPIWILPSFLTSVSKSSTSQTARTNRRFFVAFDGLIQETLQHEGIYNLIRFWFFKKRGENEFRMSHNHQAQQRKQTEDDWKRRQAAAVHHNKQDPGLARHTTAILFCSSSLSSSLGTETTNPPPPLPVQPSPSPSPLPESVWDVRNASNLTRRTRPELMAAMESLRMI